MNTERSLGPGWLLWIARGALLALALWLGGQAWQRNLAEACWRDEWPRLPSCTPLTERSPGERAAALRERVASNPGDSQAWVALAVLVQPEGTLPSPDSAAVLATATRLAPNDAQVLLMQARLALQAKDWTTAVQHLSRLSVFHQQPNATRALAQLMVLAVQQPVELAALYEALSQALRADHRWLEHTVRAMPGAKLEVIYAMPLVSQAIEHGVLSPGLGQFVIRHLKAEGRWLDAYVVWLSLWKKPLALLFNGDFEQPFISHGFDWEITDTNLHRAGAQVYQSGRGERGQVLQVVFTGREMRLPIVRQHLLLTPGRYRLTGEFQSSELRSQQGLSWVLSCAVGGQELGHSAPVLAQGRQWQTLELDFVVPPDCGFGVALALLPQAAFEARAGIRGEVLFDRFRLTQEPAR